jgi:hypothetical protein
MLTSKRPDLRAPIVAMLGQLLGAVRTSSEIPLTTLVEVVVGDRLSQGVRERIDQRGKVQFQDDGQASRFANDGPELRIELKRFDLLLPTRLSGSARLVGGDGVSLAFDRHATPTAAKLFVRVGLKSVELSPRRVVVNMATAALSQCLELDP